VVGVESVSIQEPIVRVVEIVGVTDDVVAEAICRRLGGTTLETRIPNVADLYGR
jgi:hypothetical protein